MELLISFVTVFLVILIIPIVIYGLFSVFFGLREPDKKLPFFIGIAIQKIGTTIGFVALFYLGRDYFLDQWLMYGFVWFAMYALAEIGQVVMPGYTKKEAVAGIVSEAIYFPLAAYIISILIA